MSDNGKSDFSEANLQERLEIILTFSGMQVIGRAGDGQEALAILAENFCDIALVDLNMKGMGGIELISHMKADYPSISEGTVKNYISAVYAKMGIHDRAKLVVLLRGQ